MEIQNQLTDSAVLEELGARLRTARLERNLTQSQLAEEAGVGRVTVQRMEDGEPGSVISLIRVLRALGLLENLERVLPEMVPSPLEELRRHGRQRQRASGGRSSPPAKERSAWRWGDELTDEP